MSARLDDSRDRGIEARARELPAALKGEATTIVLDAAHAAKDEIVGQYPLGPPREQNGKLYPGGNLKKGVKVIERDRARTASRRKCGARPRMRLAAMSTAPQARPLHHEGWRATSSSGAMPPQSGVYSRR